MLIDMPRTPTARRVKWAHLHEIDYRTRVGTPAWYAHNQRGARHLSALRRLHMLRTHGGVRRIAASKGRTVATFPTPLMVKAVQSIETTGRP